MLFLKQSFKGLFAKSLFSFKLVFWFVFVNGKLFSQDFSQKLFIPDTLSTKDYDTIHLNIEETQKVFFPKATSSVIPGFPLYEGDTMPIQTFSYTHPKISNPGILGPTLVWWKGDSVTMEVENLLMDTTTTHWHGAHVAAHNDGGPHEKIAPQKIWRPSFKVMDDVSTMWYHPHLHMMTMMQVNMGMAGLIIVKDKNDPFLNILPHSYGIDDYPIILQDKFFIQGNSKDMQHDMIDTECSMGTTFLVNGTWAPYLNVPAQNVRFRFLNGSSERAYCLFLRDSTDHKWVPFQVIASDAGYLDKPYKMGTPPQKLGNLDSLLIMMSGERYEIVFDASTLQGHDLYLLNMRNLMVGNDQVQSFAGGPSLNDPNCYSYLIPKGGMLPDSSFDSTSVALLKIVVDKSTLSKGTVPVAFAPYQTYDMSNLVQRKKFLLNYNSDTAAPPFSIDSVNFAMDKINDTIYLNDTEVWNVKNISGVAHPFHIHDIHFFIKSINGVSAKVPPYMRGPKDVAPVTDSSNFELIMQFTDFATPIDPQDTYMYHCHILAHEDGGMMHQFVVTPKVIVSALNEESNDEELNYIYPNPIKDVVYLIEDLTLPVKVRLTDVNEHLIFERQINHPQIDLSTLPNGVYVLKFDNGNIVKSQRIVIVH